MRKTPGYLKRSTTTRRVATVRLLVSTILHSLLHVAVHVRQTKSVHRQAACLYGRPTEVALDAAVVRVVAVKVGLRRRQRLACVKWRQCARPGRVRPLSFDRQPVPLSRLRAQPPDELLHIVPAHLLHRAIGAAILKVARVESHY